MSKQLFVSKDALFVEPMDTYTIGKHRFALFLSHAISDGFPGVAHTFSIRYDYIHWGVINALVDIYLHAPTVIYTDYWEHVYMEDLLQRLAKHYNES